MLDANSHTREDYERVPLVYHWPDGSFIATDCWDFDQLAAALIENGGPPTRVCLSSRTWPFFDDHPTLAGDVKRLPGDFHA